MKKTVGKKMVLLLSCSILAACADENAITRMQNDISASSALSITAATEPAANSDDFLLKSLLPEPISFPTGLNSSDAVVENSSTADIVISENVYEPEYLYVSSARGLNLREKPNSQSRSLLVMKYNQIVYSARSVDTDEGIWLFVSFEDVQGWASAKHLQKDRAPLIVPAAPEGYIHTRRLSNQFYANFVQECLQIGTPPTTAEDIYNRGVIQIIEYERLAEKDGQPSCYDLMQYGEKQWHEQFLVDGEYPKAFSVLNVAKEGEIFLIPSNILREAIHSWFGVWVDIPKLAGTGSITYNEEHDLIFYMDYHLRGFMPNATQPAKLLKVNGYTVMMEVYIKSNSHINDEIVEIGISENPDGSYSIVSSESRGA